MKHFVVAVYLQEVLRNSRAIVPEHVLREYGIPVLESLSPDAVSSDEFRKATKKLKTDRWRIAKSTVTTTSSAVDTTTTPTSSDEVFETVETTEPVGFELFNLFQGIGEQRLRKSRSVDKLERNVTDQVEQYCQSSQSTNTSDPKYCSALNGSSGPIDKLLVSAVSAYPTASTEMGLEVVLSETTADPTKEGDFLASNNDIKDPQQTTDKLSGAAPLLYKSSSGKTAIDVNPEETSAMPVSSISAAGEELTGQINIHNIDDVSSTSSKMQMRSTAAVESADINDIELNSSLPPKEILPTPTTSVVEIGEIGTESVALVPEMSTSTAANAAKETEKEDSDSLLLITDVSKTPEMQLPVTTATSNSTNNFDQETDSLKITDASIDMTNTTSSASDNFSVSTIESPRQTVPVRRKPKYSQGSYKPIGVKMQLTTDSSSALPLRNFLRAARLNQKSKPTPRNLHVPIVVITIFSGPLLECNNLITSTWHPSNGYCSHA